MQDYQNTSKELEQTQWSEYAKRFVAARREANEEKSANHAIVYDVQR